MIEGILISAGSVALGQWIAKWRNEPRLQQPQWPLRSGFALGRLVARLIGKNARKSDRKRRGLAKHAGYVSGSGRT